MKKLLFISFILILTSNQLWAQREERYENEDNQEQQEYDKEFTYGLNWNTNGSFLGGISLKYGWQLKKSQTQYHIVGLEIVSVVHPRELSIRSAITGSSYIDGKANSFYVIRMNFGREMLVFKKSEEEGVQVTWINAVGLSLGYMKPYYLAYGPDSANVEIQRYNTSMNEKFIWGSGGFFKGFDEMVNYTGIHYKTSLNFELGKFRNSASGLEIGAMFELMPKEIILIPKAENKQFFVSLFVNLYLGIR